MKTRKGFSVWEIILFTIFLAVVCASTIFFFFINSSDVRKAEQKYEWVNNLNEMLDEICSEISNCVYLDTPFIGESNECFYYSPVDPSQLEIGKDLEGFVFSDGKLNYVMKDGRPVTKRFGKISNPLVSNCIEGKFVRISASQLEMSFKTKNIKANSGDSEIREFKRIINLRNQ